MPLQPPIPNIEPAYGEDLAPARLAEIFAFIQGNLDFLYGQFPLQQTNLAVGGASNWIKPVLLNTWENYEAEGGTFANAMYRRGVDGRVTIIGLVKHTAAGANGTVIFTLPVGYRPSKQLLFNDGAKRVDVNSAGAVIYQGGEPTVSYLTISVPPFYPN
jgi:hypothetical protein